MEAIGCLSESTVDLIATGSADGTIRIWERHDDGETQDQVGLLQTIQCSNKYPTALAMAYLPDSSSNVYLSGQQQRRLLLTHSFHFSSYFGLRPHR